MDVGAAAPSGLLCPIDDDAIRAALDWSVLPLEASAADDEAGLATRAPVPGEEEFAYRAEAGWEGDEDGPAYRGAREGQGGIAGELPAWLAEVPADVVFDYLDRRERARPAELLPGLLPRHLGRGAGFDAGGVGDQLPPGMTLAGLAGDAWQQGLSRLSDDELAGLMAAWRRLASWATAGELAAVAELADRRAAQVAAGADPHLAEHLADELAAVLRLTSRSAGDLLDFAAGLARLPQTRRALAGGDIDRAKALVVVGELAGLDAHTAGLVDAALIGRAKHQTTGQLRAAAKRAVLAADPAAARRRRETALKQARVEIWDERAGTAALAGRDLPPADVLAADKHISALARRLKGAGLEGSMDQLRARVYTALLLGHDPAALLAPSAADGAAGPGTCHAPGGQLAAGLAGSVNLTMPLAAWLGVSDAPGEAAGFGPIPAQDARNLADLAACQPGSRWCLTLTNHAGRAIAHGCARRSPGARSGGWALSVTIRPLAAGDCTHQRETPGYRPSLSLRHAINIRQRSCAFPGCRRPASGCDLDHTVPYAEGGRTCECNCAPLCRRHHRAKQAPGWQLHQPRPGITEWRLPHGRTYRTEPGAFPD